MYETSCQSRFNARYWMLGAGALGRPKGMVWGGRREEGSGWGTRVYLWWIHVDIWQNQYNNVNKCNTVAQCLGSNNLGSELPSLTSHMTFTSMCLSFLICKMAFFLKFNFIFKPETLY